jgi:hypothetical protein
VGRPVVRVARKWLKYDTCGTCQAKPSRPCVHLTVLKGRRHEPKELKAPHQGRARTATT